MAAPEAVELAAVELAAPEVAAPEVVAPEVVAPEMVAAVAVVVAAVAVVVAAVVVVDVEHAPPDHPFAAARFGWPPRAASIARPEVSALSIYGSAGLTHRRAVFLFA